MGLPAGARGPPSFPDIGRTKLKNAFLLPGQPSMRGVARLRLRNWSPRPAGYIHLILEEARRPEKLDDVGPPLAAETGQNLRWALSEIAGCPCNLPRLPLRAREDINP